MGKQERGGRPLNYMLKIPVYMQEVFKHIESGKRVVITPPRYTLSQAMRDADKAVEKALNEIG